MSQLVVIQPFSAWDRKEKWKGDPSREPDSGETSVRLSAHVLGLFNTGTNFLDSFLSKNDVPTTDWRLSKLFYKHYPLRILCQLIAAVGRSQTDDALFIVLSRDPYQWISSMKSMPYEAVFSSVWESFSISLSAINNGVTYESHLSQFGGSDDWAPYLQADNIVEYWNNYYSEFIGEANKIFNNLILLRYEDLVLHPCECAEIIRRHAGLLPAQQVTIPIASAKPGHSEGAGTYWDARRKLIRQTPPANLSADETRFISDNLSAEVCERLGYEVQ